MIDRILVPLDRSELAERALRVAIPIARRSGAVLRLVYAWPSQVAPYVSQFGGVITGALEERGDAEEYLKRIAAETEGHGVRAETVLLAPPAAKAIRDEARATDVDLIVMSTHGRTGWSRVWLGSVADAVIRESDVPVLLVRIGEEGTEPPGEPKSVLVPLDGTPEAAAILGVLGAFFESTPVELRLLRVVSPVLLAQVTPESGVPIFDVDNVATKTLQREAEAYLAQEAATLRGRLPQATVEHTALVHSSAARAIVDAAKGVALVAMVPCIHGAARLVLGSVTDKVLRGTDASFLVIRPPRGDA